MNHLFGAYHTATVQQSQQSSSSSVSSSLATIQYHHPLGSQLVLAPPPPFEAHQAPFHHHHHHHHHPQLPAFDTTYHHFHHLNQSVSTLASYNPPHPSVYCNTLTVNFYTPPPPPQSYIPSPIPNAPIQFNSPSDVVVQSVSQTLLSSSTPSSSSPSKSNKSSSKSTKSTKSSTNSPTITHNSSIQPSKLLPKPKAKKITTPSSAAAAAARPQPTRTGSTTLVMQQSFLPAPTSASMVVAVVNSHHHLAPSPHHHLHHLGAGGGNGGTRPNSSTTSGHHHLGGGGGTMVSTTTTSASNSHLGTMYATKRRRRNSKNIRLKDGLLSTAAAAAAAAAAASAAYNGGLPNGMNSLIPGSNASNGGSGGHLIGGPANNNANNNHNGNNHHSAQSSSQAAAAAAAAVAAHLANPHSHHHQSIQGHVIGSTNQNSSATPSVPTKTNPSKRHRERLNSELDMLASLLPFDQSVLSKLDKLSILRLSVSYLRTKSYFQSALRKDREAQLQLQQSQASPDSTGDRALALTKSPSSQQLNNGYHNGGNGNFYEQAPPPPPPPLHHVHHHHVHHHHHHHVHHYDGGSKSPPNCPSGPAPSMATIMAAVEAMMEGDLILQALNGFLMILTCEGEVFYTSHTVETYLGFHQSDICHQSVYELVHSEDREELQRHLMWNVNLPTDRSNIKLDEIVQFENIHLLERNFTVRFRCLLDNTSGFLRLDVRGRIKVLHGQNHKTEDAPMALFAVCTPFGPPSLLEMPANEKALFKSKHKLDFSLVSMEPRGRTLLGYSEIELSNRGGYDLIHHDDLFYVASAHQELLKTGASGLIAYRIVNKDCVKWQWLQTSARLVYKNSKPDFILCTHRPLMEEEGRDLLSKRTMDFKVTYLDGGLGAITVNRSNANGLLQSSALGSFLLDSIDSPVSAAASTTPTAAAAASTNSSANKLDSTNSSSTEQSNVPNSKSSKSKSSISETKSTTGGNSRSRTSSGNANSSNSQKQGNTTSASSAHDSKKTDTSSSKTKSSKSTPSKSSSAASKSKSQESGGGSSSKKQKTTHPYVIDANLYAPHAAHQAPDPHTGALMVDPFGAAAVAAVAAESFSSLSQVAHHFPGAAAAAAYGAHFQGASGSVRNAGSTNSAPGTTSPVEQYQGAYGGAAHTHQWTPNPYLMSSGTEDPGTSQAVAAAAAAAAVQHHLDVSGSMFSSAPAVVPVQASASYPTSHAALSMAAYHHHHLSAPQPPPPPYHHHPHPNPYHHANTPTQVSSYPSQNSYSSATSSPPGPIANDQTNDDQSPAGSVGSVGPNNRSNNNSSSSFIASPAPVRANPFFSAENLLSHYHSQTASRLVALANTGTSSSVVNSSVTPYTQKCPSFRDQYGLTAMESPYNSYTTNSTASVVSSNAVGSMANYGQNEQSELNAEQYRSFSMPTLAGGDPFGGFGSEAHANGYRFGSYHHHPHHPHHQGSFTNDAYLKSGMHSNLGPDCNSAFGYPNGHSLGSFGEATNGGNGRNFNENCSVAQGHPHHHAFSSATSAYTHQMVAPPPLWNAGFTIPPITVPPMVTTKVEPMNESSIVNVVDQSEVVQQFSSKSSKSSSKASNQQRKLSSNSKSASEEAANTMLSISLGSHTVGVGGGGGGPMHHHVHHPLTADTPPASASSSVSSTSSGATIIDDSILSSGNSSGQPSWEAATTSSKPSPQHHNSYHSPLGPHPSLTSSSHQSHHLQQQQHQTQSSVQHNNQSNNSRNNPHECFLSPSSTTSSQSSSSMAPMNCAGGGTTGVIVGVKQSSTISPLSDARSMTPTNDNNATANAIDIEST